MANLLFVGGGSVGHIAPAVAVWEACQALLPEAKAYFVCSQKAEDQSFLKNQGLPHTPLNAPRLSWSFPKQFIRAVHRAKQIINEQQPDLIFSKGGYVSLPMCMAALNKKVPIVLHESDAVSGYANRIMSHFATAVCTGFPSKYHHTGNPVRHDIANGSKAEGLRMTGLKGDRPILLVMGGSQGATSINEHVADLLPELLLRCDIIHLTGKGKQVVATNNDRYYQAEFAGDELKHLYACSDLAVSRAGAGSLAELAACGLPTIVVPLRGVGHDHQYRNAIQAASSGGCLHIEQAKLGDQLLPAIHNLVADEARRTAMSQKIRTLHTPDAALQIAQIVVQALDSAPGDQ